MMIEVPFKALFHTLVTLINYFIFFNENDQL